MLWRAFDHNGHTMRFVPIATLGDLAEAQILAARLESEGVPARLAGESLGPYRISIGQMAETRLLVPEDRYEDARMILLDSEVAVALSGPAPHAEKERWPLWAKVVAVAIGLIFALIFVVNLVRVG